ncbi:hypothetical protein ASD19_01660 [Microbacterium sp. Root53]|nr:hypothetical protein ASD19_01660 [Microbacterium sp. Root53]
MEVAHHFNMDDDTRASNWTGVTRGGELALRLATRGDGWFDAGETRIPMLVNEVGLHLDAAYTDTGWMQEGLWYINYTLQIALPGIYAAQDAGITALDASIERPQFTNLYLHSLANTPNHKRLQWGATSMQGRFHRGHDRAPGPPEPARRLGVALRALGRVARIEGARRFSRPVPAAGRAWRPSRCR